VKILITIPCLLTGGTEIQTLNLVRALVQGGHQVIVTCYFEYTPAMVQCYQDNGSKVICLSPNGMRIGGWKGILFLFKGLKKVIRNERPDIAHVQYMAPGAIPIFLLRLLGMKNIIATTHTAADIYPNLRLIHFVQKYCVRVFTCITMRAEKSFFGSAELYNSSTILKKRNHFTIYNALPPYIHIREEQKPFSDGQITLGVVSRLERIKGMDLVVPAFAKLKKQYTDIQLLVVGDGSQRSIMQEQAIELGVNDSVEWMGRQEQPCLQSLYDRIDILLMPSRSEGFGLTAIEGMARGCVVVASDTGGLPEVVKDGETGLLHQVEDVEDMTVKIQSLLESRMRIIQLSRNSVSYVSQFSFAKYATAFCNLYERIKHIN